MPDEQKLDKLSDGARNDVAYSFGWQKRPGENVCEKFGRRNGRTCGIA